MSTTKPNKAGWTKGGGASGEREIALLGCQIENRDGVYLGTVTSIEDGQANYQASNGDLGHALCMDIRVRGSQEPFPEPTGAPRRHARPAPGAPVATTPRQKRKDAVPDEVSELFAGKTPEEVMAITSAQLNIDCKALYGHLNNGQIRMQCGNKLRSFMKKCSNVSSWSFTGGKI